MSPARTVAVRPTPAAPSPVLHGAGSAWLLAGYALVWLSMLVWCARTAPVDDLEQLVWVRALAWGYYKHPPLPTWLLAPLVQLFGPQPWTTYVLGALCTTLALGLLAGTLRAMRGARYATVVLLADLCITFYAARLYYYNHNVVMLATGSVAIALLWRLTQRPSRLAWVGVGVALGLGMLAKYQTALLALAAALWFVRAGLWRDARQRQGALLAAVLAAVLFAPHLVWLVQHDWLPLHYAHDSSLGAQLSLTERPLHALNWAADWLLNRSGPAWLLLAVAAWGATRGPAADARAPSPPAAAPTEADRLRRDFLTLFGLLPLLAMVLMALLGGVSLQMHWGTAFALWTVPALLEWLPRLRARLDTPRALALAWLLFGLLQGLLLVNHWAGSPHGPLKRNQHHWEHFPSAALAARIGPPARARLGGPIDIVSGDPAVAAAIASQLPERPRVLLAGRLDISPWIAADELPPDRARVIEVFPTDRLPSDAVWAAPGLAWRPGVSSRSGRKVKDWSQRRWEPGPDEASDAAAAALATSNPQKP